MCHRTIKGILGSFPEALIYEYLVLVFLGGFYCCEIVVGRFEIVVGRCGSLWVVLRSLWVVLRSLWIVVGRCGSLWIVVDRCGSFRLLVITPIGVVFGRSTPCNIIEFIDC